MCRIPHDPGRARKAPHGRALNTLDSHQPRARRGIWTPSGRPVARISGAPRRCRCVRPDHFTGRKFRSPEDGGERVEPPARHTGGARGSCPCTPPALAAQGSWKVTVYEHELDLELGPCTAEHLTVQLRATGLARFRGYALSGIVLGLGVPVAFVGGAWTGVGLGMVGLSGLTFWASRHVSQHQGAVLTQARYPLGTEPGGPAAPPGCTAVSGAPQGESEVAPVSDPGDRRSL